mmetsp:Transcript_2809/g.5721  ORF Transcript_2809/g.5721 Transcript_2809/m.5721 type:complete len:90 (+) Transcript_2809:339-608(+)
MRSTIMFDKRVNAPVTTKTRLPVTSLPTPLIIAQQNDNIKAGIHLAAGSLNVRKSLKINPPATIGAKNPFNESFFHDSSALLKVPTPNK